MLEDVVIWISDGMGRRCIVPQGYRVFDKYNDKKLFISKRQKALSIFGGILVGVFGVASCTGAIHHMNVTSNSDVPVSRSSAP